MRAIDADKIVYSWQIDADGQEHDGVTLQSIIDKMPTIEPERKTGRWIDETFKPWGLVHHPYKCDQCGEHSETDSDFCPNCGAKMEGEG